MCSSFIIVKIHHPVDYAVGSNLIILFAIEEIEFMVVRVKERITPGNSHKGIV